MQECLQSLACQSRQADEIVLVEDGALSDGLLCVIREFKSILPIKSIRLEKNSGLAVALNVGLHACSHDLIARMDTDDISLPNRFEEQVYFMINNKDIDVCSAYIEERDDDMSKVLSTRMLPVNNEDIISFAKIRSPISHPVVIYRKSAILSVGGYPEIYPEDYPLWCILIANGNKFSNIPKVLLLMRSGEGMISRRGYDFLMGYIKTYMLMRELKIIGWLGLIRNVLIQCFVRLSPSSVRRLLYKYARK